MSREIFLDFETEHRKGVSLKKMTLRQYLAAAAVLGVSVAEGDDEPTWFPADCPEWRDMLDLLRAAAPEEDTIFIAHNAAFDIRVMRYGWTRNGGPLNLPQPQRVRCSLELACAAWPNQPGGYGLEILSKTLNLGLEKLGKGADVGRMSAQVLEQYCNQDTRMCRAIYRRAGPHLHEYELALAEAANRCRELYLDVSADKVEAAIKEFGEVASEEVEAALETLGEGGDMAFGWDGSKVKSVKPGQLRDLLLDNLGFDTKSTSVKKINPEKLRANAAAADVVNHVGKANKALHTVRKTRVFRGSQVADVELGYARAHTFRYSCPAVGKGINLHGLGKRDKRMAKITRSMFSIQEPYCLVRADLANVEYRVGGLLYGCDHITRLFEADIMADPYSMFWKAATGRIVTKADPERAVPKQAVLQLEYLAGLENWTGVLQQCIADPTFGATLADLERMCEAQHWGPPATPNGKRVMTKTRAPWQVVTVAERSRDLFHKVHPEFRLKTKWLEALVHQASRTLDYDTGNRIIDHFYTMPAALDRNLVDVHWDGRFEGASVRVRCGNWPAETVTWRDLGLRPIGMDGGMCMSAMSGRKGYRPLRTTVMIENIAQSAARNGGCQAKMALEARGYPWVYSVHDELMLIVPKTREWVLKARADFLNVLGPNKLPGWKWSVLVNPDEITVTRTMWEVEPGQLLPPIGEKNGKPVYPKNHVWWDRLQAGEETLLENLP